MLRRGGQWGGSGGQGLSGFATLCVARDPLRVTPAGFCAGASRGQVHGSGRPRPEE